MSHKPSGRPHGRPSGISDIDAVVGTDENGQPITVADQIVSYVRRGHYWTDCCARAGVTKEGANSWLRTAGKIWIRAKGRTIQDLHLSPHDLACVYFAAAVDAAEALACGDMLDGLDALGRGGLKQEVVTVTTGGDDPKTTTTTRYTLPDRAALAWRLKHRWPEKFAERIEISDVRGEVTPEERAGALVESLSTYLEGVHDASATPATLE